MNIRPSAAIRQNYNEIADLCRKTEEPIFLTKNGEGDLVVMDIETYNRWEKMLKLREELLAVEEDRLAGRGGCTVDELDAYLDQAYGRQRLSGHCFRARKTDAGCAYPFRGKGEPGCCHLPEEGADHSHPLFEPDAAAISLSGGRLYST